MHVVMCTVLVVLLVVRMLSLVGIPLTQAGSVLTKVWQYKIKGLFTTLKNVIFQSERLWEGVRIEHIIVHFESREFIDI